MLSIMGHRFGEPLCLVDALSRPLVRLTQVLYALLFKLYSSNRLLK